MSQKTALERSFDFTVEWLMETLEKATQPTEWGNPHFDAIEDHKTSDPQTEAVFVLLSTSSLSAYPNGWTPRREARKRAKELATKAAHLANLLSIAFPEAR